MAKFKVWQVGETIPLRLVEANIGLERNLEAWIEADPTLLPGELEIVARQMIVDGGRLDLLGLDPLGRCAVIELKAGALLADVVAQAMYYAAQVDKYDYQTLASKIRDYPAGEKKELKTLLQDRELDENEFIKSKEVLIYLVGTQHTTGVDDMLAYLSKKIQVPVTQITFDVFQLENGQRILVREITEADAPGIKPPGHRGEATLDSVCKKADQHGIGEEFRYIMDEAKKLGLHMRPYVRTIMYTHPDHKTRMLFTVKANHKPMTVYIGYEAFVEYYPVTTEQVASALGPPGWQKFNKEQAQVLLSGLKTLISSVAS